MTDTARCTDSHTLAPAWLGWDGKYTFCVMCTRCTFIVRDPSEQERTRLLGPLVDPDVTRKVTR